MDNNTPMRRCSKCGIEKPATSEFFYRRHDRPLGLQYKCKECKNSEDHEQRLVNNPPKPQPRDGHKICTKCGEEKLATLEFFYGQKIASDGLHPWCKTCHNANHKTWVDAHPEYSKAYMRRYNAENKERMDEQKREYRLRTKEQTAEWNKKYYAANKEKLNAYSRRLGKQHYQENREYYYAKDINRRARKQSLPNTFTAEQWHQCLEYFNYCCAVCGKQLRDLFGDVAPHRDHWIPLNYKGDDNPGSVANNMVCLCNECNLSKNDKMPQEWLKQKFGTSKARAILERIGLYFASLDL
jgi:hypothetical protein